MLAILLAGANLPFTLAFALVLALGLIELLAMLLGLSLFGALDDGLPQDVDYDAGAAGITDLLGWLCLKRLPLLIWLVLALSSFAIAGLSLNFIYYSLSGAWLPGGLAVPLTLVLACLSCRYLGAGLARVLPRNETSAVSLDALGGCVAIVTQGRAVKGRPAEALVRDAFQQKHYVLVEPEEEGAQFEVGTQLVLLARSGRVWSAGRLES